MKKPGQYHIIIRNSFRTIKRNRVFLRNFLSIIVCMTCILVVFSLVIYHRTNDFLENELIASNDYQLKATAQEIDSRIKSVAYQNMAIGVGDFTKSFFISSEPEGYITDFRQRTVNALRLLQYGNPTIDSIYLYSAQSPVILTNNGTSSASFFEDKSCLSHLEEGFEGTHVVFRAKNDRYPFLLTVITQLPNMGHTGAVITNLNLNELAGLHSVELDPQLSFFIVSDTGEIVYRDRQTTVTEALSTEPMLSHFQPDTAAMSVLENREEIPYVFSQYHSDNYPWSYVLVTRLPQYNAQLSNNSATLFALCFGSLSAMILLAFIFTSHAAKPVQSILRFIQKPSASISAEMYSNADIQHIANQIVQFSQQNEFLSEQLTSKLKVLNDTRILALQAQINPHFLFNTLNMLHMLECEELGYDHKIPDITLSLSKLLRYCVESTDPVPLETEIGFTQTYTSILLERYIHKPEIEYHISPEAMSAIVPRLFIQPLIENAFHHGLISRENAKGHLRIQCETDGAYCTVTVRDNGIGMPPDKLQSLRRDLNTEEAPTGHIGLKNIASRMRLIYGEEFSIEVTSQEGTGTAVILRFPLISRPPMGNAEL